MNSVGFQAQIGLMDYGILNTLQVDPYGNINSTALGDYNGEHRRFGGPGGADSIAAMCWKTILMTDQQKRKFVPRVDFISSPGFLDGTEGARERAGLPRGTGPYRVVTPWAVFDYEDRHLRLAGVSPFVTVEMVLEQMSFEPKMAKEIETSADADRGRAGRPAQRARPARPDHGRRPLDRAPRRRPVRLRRVGRRRRHVPAPQLVRRIAMATEKRIDPVCGMEVDPRGGGR